MAALPIKRPCPHQQGGAYLRVFLPYLLRDCMQPAAIISAGAVLAEPCADLGRLCPGRIADPNARDHLPGLLAKMTCANFRSLRCRPPRRLVDVSLIDTGEGAR